MAYARSNNNSKHGAPSMPRRTTDSDDDSPPPSSHRTAPKTTKTNSYVRTNSDDPETATIELVKDFKRAVQNKTRHGGQMTDSDVELEVADIRRSANPDQCDFNRWKRNLPRDIQNCSKTVLSASMAYGNDPREVQSIIEMKMNSTNSNEDPTDTSLDNIIGPLKKLKKELDKNKSPNLFNDIRNFNDRDIGRANRLFLTEARHFAPGVKDYTYTDAQEAVKAIRETDYETDDPKTLLAITKALRGTDDIRDYLLNEMSQKNKKRDESPPRRTISSDDDHAPNSPPITNSSTSNKKNSPNDTSSFHIKPFDNPYPSNPSIGATSRRLEHLPQGASTRISGTSQRFENRPQDEPPRSPPRERPARK